jgi:hypothetical protein
MMSKEPLGYDSVPFNVKISPSRERPTGPVHLAYDVPMAEASAIYRDEARQRGQAWSRNYDARQRGRAWSAAYEAERQQSQTTRRDDPGIPNGANDMGDYMSDEEIEKVRKALGNLDPDLWSKLETILRGGPAESGRDRQDAEADTREVLDANDRMACDSAAEVYGRALGYMGVRHVGIRDPRALKAIFQGERAKRRKSGAPLLACDEKTAATFAERFPHAAKIGLDQYPGFNR